MGIYDKKLGDVLERKEFGAVGEIFNKEPIRLLKVTYTYQDADGVTMDASLKHKDYYEEDDDSELAKEAPNSPLSAGDGGLNSSKTSIEHAEPSYKPETLGDTNDSIGKELNKDYAKVVGSEHGR